MSKKTSKEIFLLTQDQNHLYQRKGRHCLVTSEDKYNRLLVNAVVLNLSSIASRTSPGLFAIKRHHQNPALKEKVPESINTAFDLLHGSFRTGFTVQIKHILQHFVPVPIANTHQNVTN